MFERWFDENDCFKLAHGGKDEDEGEHEDEVAAIDDDVANDEDEAPADDDKPDTDEDAKQLFAAWLDKPPPPPAASPLCSFKLFKTLLL